MTKETPPVGRMEYYRDSTQKVLPLVYSDALTYLESMSRVVHKLNEVIDLANNVTTNAVEQAGQYTDEKLIEYSAEVQSAIGEINQLYAELGVQYDNFVNEVNNRITLIHGKLDKMQDNVDSVLGQANAYTQQAIANNNEYVVDQTTKALKTVTVLNYFTGQRIGIQNMFDYLAQFHLANAITFDQIAGRNKTYDEFNGMNMTYTDLALNGSTLFN